MSVLNLFSVGIGPSSSHTNGPMRAACHFVSNFVINNHQSAAVSIELFGSLALTGKGHGIERAIIAGLHANNPDHVDPDTQ